MPSLRSASNAQAASRISRRRRARHRRRTHRALLTLAIALAIGGIALGAIGNEALLGRAAIAGRAQHAGTSAVADSTAWYLVLVNSTHPLPESFSIETTEMPSGELVDARIADPLSQMLDACTAAGYVPFVRSGFRTRETQQAILDNRIAEYESEGLPSDRAREAALDWVALPGTSEHELGLAVDINDANGGEGMYDWLANHAHEYGFIQRYPPDASAITGISHEPWHYRYVGVEAATEIWQQGITLEEYLTAA